MKKEFLPQYTAMFCFELTFQPAKTDGTSASALARVVKEGIAAEEMVKLLSVKERCWRR